MSIDLDSFPLLNYEKDREGLECPQRTETKFDSLPILSTINKARPGPGLSLLFCSRHEKDARKRYSQRAEDPLRVCLGRELYDLFPYCIESIKKRGQCYGPLLFDPILTGDEPPLP
ncbi:hypothetical protein T459_19315 [Capsicum annuum]|uniref:Uncharacterized protein n=1 Tax=Capsicum annuum TaxID=4072 RepID=A0A2G2Z1D7_CAPAN|nr:hypothetical protein T459_19315 [Capsicum annuum]